MKDKLPSNKPAVSSKTDIQAFLQQAATMPVRHNADRAGRLLFAIDATASRQPTWDTAKRLQSKMFQATEALGGLQTQLCYYRGLSEFHASKWLDNTDALLAAMARVSCLGGHTQIGRVLAHAQAERRRQAVNAVVFIGDAMEESADHLCQLAGELGLLGAPLFIFQEGYDPAVRSVFQQMSQLSGGAYCPFDENSADLLAELLAAVAVYAAGGYRALEQFSRHKSDGVRQLTQQVQTALPKGER
ncbi:VWA domain-containing protein [Exilibacterium tricleocarpae]|uniref:VWA domain-containing protein n=1 Tax=Exilibacterium tricleocarpae TaxID=2591008 RepID=A0A545TLZ2_9GAMM|nr:VWA domain-containing protein [Exilibacterium tricleocarpae]TQV78250.1 VWA domain-containing protein [Exilibacterium tricleocarpae]